MTFDPVTAQQAARMAADLRGRRIGGFPVAQQASPYVQAMATADAHQAPPTVTTGTSTTSFAGSTRTLPATDHRLRVEGTTLLPVSGGSSYYRPRKTIVDNDPGPSPGGGQPFRISFGLYGSAFEIPVFAYNTGVSFRIWTDGRPGPWETYSPADSTVRYVLVSYDTTAFRNITIESEATGSGLAFAGITVPITSNIAPPTIGSPLKIACVTDSFGEAASGPTKRSYSYLNVMCRLLGITDFANFGQGGTGLVTASAPTHGVKYIDRLAEWVAYEPDAMYIQGSINDRSDANVGLVGPALATMLDTVTEAIPSVKRFVVTSPILAHTEDSAKVTAMTAIAAEMEAVCDARGIGYVDTFNEGASTGAATQWILGTGNAGAPTGNGFADIACAADAVHPNDLGHEYLGQRMAREIAPFLGIAI